MTRWMRMAVLLALLVWPMLPGVAAAQDACQQLLPAGLYNGNISAVMTIRAYAEGQLVQEFTYNDTATLSLNIACAVSGGSAHWNIHRTLMFYPGQPPIVCDYVVDYSQATGNVVTGSNGLPRIDVRWGQGMVAANDCTDAGSAPPATWQFSLSSPPGGTTISGDFRILYDDPDGMDYEQLAQMFRDQGFEVTLTKGWTLTREPQPEVLGLTASLRQYFLAGIPVTNRYTASIDWDDAGPGTARFILNGGAARPMNVNGNTATYDLPLASVAGTGDFPISVEAELDGRVSRMDNLGPLTLVPVPAWVGPFHLQPQTQGDHVRYSGNWALPEKPLDARVVLPTALPYVGGTWGVLPTQLKLDLAANSLGTRETGGLSAQGGFGLGKQVYKLAAAGNIYGTITHDSLNLESDELKLSTPKMSYREHLGLVSVIPGASSLFSVPFLGDVLQALDSALGVTGEVHGSMTGRGRLGVSGDTLKLTEGNFDATLGVTATGGLDTPVAWATVSGGGDGSLSMQIVPTVKVNSCQVLLSFALRAGAFGYNAVNVGSSYPLYQCAVGSSSAALAAQGFALRYGGEGGAAEQGVMLTQATNDLSETVLVQNASPVARPALAVGANGKMALVWNSVSGSGAADAVSVRLFDGATWAALRVINEAGRPAFTPNAAYAANGNLVVAWAEAQVAPDPAGLTEAYLRSFEIAWAEIDAGTGQVRRRGKIASDNILDFAPRLSRAPDGSVWLAWQRSPGTSLTGKAAAPNQIQAARWAGNGWTAPETAGQNVVGALFWDIAAADANRVWLVADADMDGNLATAADREIFLYKRTAGGWAAAIRLTSDAVADVGPLLAVASTGLPVAAWRHGNAVMGLNGDPANTAPQTWFAADANVGPGLAGGRLLVGADGSRALLWPDGTAQGQDVWLARASAGSQTWSKPGPLFRSAEQRRSLTATLLPNGEITLGLAAAPVVSETVNYDGGGVGQRPAVDNAARLLVATIPAGYVPQAEGSALFLPLIRR